MTSNTFEINFSDLNGYLSPLFFKSLPEKLPHTKKLGKIATINPYRIKPKFKDHELVPYIGLPDTDEHTHKVTNVQMRPFEEVKGRNIIYPKDILFARIEPSIFNKKYIFTDDLKGFDFAFTSTEFYILEGRNISQNYLFLSLLTDYFYKQLEGKTTGSTGRRRLDSDIFSKLLIPLPSNNIRERAVEKFYKAKKDKAQKESKTEELLNSIDDYLLSELGIEVPEKDNSLENRIFTTSFQNIAGRRYDPKPYDNRSQDLFNAVTNADYQTVPLKKLVIHSKSGKWGRTTNAKVDPEKYQKCLVIRATEFDNLYNLKLENDRAKYRLIKKRHLRKMDIQINDLLVEKSGGSPDQPVGRIALLRKDIVENNTLCYSNFTHKFRVDSTQVLPEYLFSFLKTIHNIKVTEIMQSQTSGIRNLIMDEYFNQDIVLPDLAVQKRIAQEIKDRRQQAKELELEAKQVVEEARQQVEEMILEEDSVAV